MALNRIQDSSENIKDDLRQIAIDRIGQVEYDNLDNISKQKIESYVSEQMIALQAFLTRQTFTITDMEAFGEIRKGKIDVDGGGLKGKVLTPQGPMNIMPGAKLVRGVTGRLADNIQNVEISVQISDEDPGYGPKVKRQVKKSAVKLKENLGMSE